LRRQPHPIGDKRILKECAEEVGYSGRGAADALAGDLAALRQVGAVECEVRRPSCPAAVALYLYSAPPLTILPWHYSIPAGDGYPVPLPGRFHRSKP
jgi:hypothetical protein